MDMRNPRYREYRRQVESGADFDTAWQQYMDAEAAARERARESRQATNRRAQAAFRQRQRRSAYDGTELVKLEVYIHPDLAARLDAYTKRTGVPKVAVVSDGLLAVLR